jgi:hypothetical protein
MASSSYADVDLRAKYPGQAPRDIVYKRLCDAVERTLATQTVLVLVSWDREEDLLLLCQFEMAATVYLDFLVGRARAEFHFGWLYSRVKELGKRLDAMQFGVDAWDKQMDAVDMQHQVIAMVREL